MIQNVGLGVFLFFFCWIWVKGSLNETLNASDAVIKWVGWDK